MKILRKPHSLRFTGRLSKLADLPPAVLATSLSRLLPMCTENSLMKLGGDLLEAPQVSCAQALAVFLFFLRPVPAGAAPSEASMWPGQHCRVHAVENSLDTERGRSGGGLEKPPPQTDRHQSLGRMYSDASHDFPHRFAAVTSKSRDWIA